jgi:hypothetical protein
MVLTRFAGIKSAERFWERCRGEKKAEPDYATWRHLVNWTISDKSSRGLFIWVPLNSTIAEAICFRRIWILWRTIYNSYSRMSTRLKQPRNNQTDSVWIRYGRVSQKSVQPLKFTLTLGNFNCHLTRWTTCVSAWVSGVARYRFTGDKNVLNKSRRGKRNRSCVQYTLSANPVVFREN